MAVVRFRAKTETSVNARDDREDQERADHGHDARPTSGRRAATIEPKTTIRATKVIGQAERLGPLQVLLGLLADLTGDLTPAGDRDR